MTGFVSVNQSFRPAEQQVVFVKSWHEWAEGNHREPDTQNGRDYLETVKKVKEEVVLTDTIGIPRKVM